MRKLHRAIFDSMPRFKKKAITGTLSSGRLDNFDPGGHPFIRLTGPAANFDLTGLVPPSTDPDGAMCLVYNATGYNMTIKHNSANSTAANRIYCFQNMSYETPSDAVVVYRGIAQFLYDSSDARWLLLTYIGV